MTPIEMFQLAIEVVIFLLLLYVAFWKSYFQEKGKNLATKEDIQEITTLVESVKSQLEYSLQAKLSLRDLEREALVDYFSKYHLWQSAILNFGNSCIGEEDLRELEEARNQLHKLKTDFDLATGKMELFVENIDITSQNAKLSVETFTLVEHAIVASYEIQQEYLEAKSVKLDTPSNERLEKHEAALNKRLELFRKFSKERVGKYRELSPLIRTHRLTISKHLRDLVNE